MPSQRASVRVVLLAGGKGERLWPKSTPALPKQYLRLIDNKSLIQAAFERVRGLVPAAAIYVVTGAAYRQLTEQELPGLPAQNIITEPEGRDTAPSLGLAALRIELEDPEAVMIALPADHYILGDRRFCVTLEAAVEAARQGGLHILGVPATRPEPGYGYIKVGETVAECRHLPVREVVRFVEKPDQETARQFVDSGDYLWNSGMLVCRVAFLRQEIARHLPVLHGLLEEMRAAAPTPAQLQAAANESFARAPRVSLDYGLLEKSDQVYVIPAYFGWHDVGSWAALEQLRPRDDHGNTVQGDAIVHGCRNLLVDASSGRVVAAVGLQDLIIVDTDSALLVCAKDAAQAVRRVAELAAPFTRDVLPTAPPEGKVVGKPWGWEVWWAVTDAYAAKVLEVMAGHSLSLQYHARKLESLYFQAGTGRLRLGETWQKVQPGHVVTLPPGTIHQIEAVTDMTIIEVSTPELEDVVRLEDRYGRAEVPTEVAGTVTEQGDGMGWSTS